MNVISVYKGVVNHAKLDEEITATIPASAYSGHSTGKSGLTLHFTEAATDEQIQTATIIAQNHNPAVLTVKQQKKKDYQTSFDALTAEVEALALETTWSAAQTAKVTRWLLLKALKDG